MCLGIPGRVVSIDRRPNELTMGKIEFGGVSRDICLEYVPDVKVGDFVIVHVGFAISVLNEQEARAVFDALTSFGNSPSESGEENA